jgi:chromosomal replication initiator protein
MICGIVFICENVYYLWISYPQVINSSMQPAFWNDFLQFAQIYKDKYGVVFSILRQFTAVQKTEKTLELQGIYGARIYLQTRIPQLQKMIEDFNGQHFDIELTTIEAKKKAPAETPLLDFQPSIQDLFIKSGLNPKYQFENYAVSSTNQVAFAAAQAIAKNPGITYNPLFLYGSTGVGKTHLAQAVARYILEHDNEKKVYYCPSDRFTNEFIESIREKSNAKFRKKYRNLSVLIVDDIQFIAGKDKVQEEFFHTFNDIIASGGQIIFTSDKPPQEIKNLEDRLRSRFSGGLTVDIGSPDFELRTAILLIKAQEKNIDIDIQAAQTIAEHVEDTRALEGTLSSIHLKILGKKDHIDFETVENFFSGAQEDDENKPQKKVSPTDVIKTVCTYYNIKQTHIKGPSRVENIALARQVCMYFLHRTLGIKLIEVAFLLHRRDHTTVIHGVDKIERLMMTDNNFKEQIDTISRSLK